MITKLEKELMHRLKETEKANKAYRLDNASYVETLCDMSCVLCAIGEHITVVTGADGQRCIGMSPIIEKSDDTEFTKVYEYFKKRLERKEEQKEEAE